MPRWGWLATLVFACGHPAPATQPTQTSGTGSAAVRDAGADASATLADDLPRLALRARQLFLDWAAAFADPNIDCVTATSRANALAETYADVAAANNAVLRAGHERVKALRLELEKYAAETEAAAKSIMESPVMARCASDPAFARSIDRMQGDP